MQIMEKAVELLKERKTFVVATVVEANGSAPQSVGAKLIYTENHELFGTVGGGRVEAKVIQEIQQVLVEKKNRLLDYKLVPEPEGIGMTCGGNMKIFVEYYGKTPRLLLFGGGHVAYEIAKLANMMKLEVVVLEERQEFAKEERFPAALSLIVKDNYDDALGEVTVDENTYVVIVTKGHKTDQRILELLIDSKAPYIGMMGSRRKKVEVYNNLKNLGITDKQLERVYCPIGLDLRGSRPEEIALAIVAEIIAVKNGGNGLILRESK